MSLYFQLSEARAFDRGTMPQRRLAMLVGTLAGTPFVLVGAILAEKVAASGLPKACVMKVWTFRRRLLSRHSAT